jgi:hypothetical protein
MDKKETYPINLLNDLNLDILSHDIKDVQKGLEYCIDNHLADKTKSVIYMRYKDGMTLKSIGEVLGVSGSRIGDIVHIGCRALRHPKSRNYIIYGYDRNEEILAAKRAEKEEFLKANESNSKLLALRSTPLEELNLSQRAYNCIYRRLWDNSLGRLMDFIRLKGGEWVRIRNMGAKTAEEIFNALLEKGYVSGTIDNPIVLVDEAPKPKKVTGSTFDFDRDVVGKPSIYDTLKGMSQYQMAQWILDNRTDIFLHCLSIEDTIKFLDKEYSRKEDGQE